MIQNEIRQRLFGLCDPDYRDFQSKLIPTVGIDSVIGVRTPDLRNYAKELSKREDICEFLNALPHDHFDENQLHAFIISLTKDYAKCLEQVKVFLPYVDNWATCDQMSPKVFKRHKSELIPEIRSWIASGKTYTVRFGIKLLMEHFLGDDFLYCLAHFLVSNIEVVLLQSLFNLAHGLSMMMPMMMLFFHSFMLVV